MTQSHKPTIFGPSPLQCIFVSVLHLLAVHKKTPFFYKIIFLSLYNTLSDDVFPLLFLLIHAKKKKLTNKKPCQTFILKGTKNKTRVNLMKTPWSVQLWLNIWHFGQTHHFLFLSSQSKMIARIIIWILNTGWKQPLLTWHS